jgi:murein DD-endopeptidase MepM/ murein hydrolase activator NlpD
MDVYSVSSGEVMRASSWNGYGETVVVEINSYQFIYAHLQYESYKVELGEIITPRNMLGKVGNTPGYYKDTEENTHPMSPHLHFEIREGNDKINPTTIYPSGVFTS